MWTLRRNQWVTLQSFLWLPLLGLSAVVPFLEVSERFRAGVHGAMLALAAASYVYLVRILGAGRNVADRITLARFGIFFLVSCAILLFERSGFGLWFLLVVSVTLDLVDGWAARRFGASEQGAVLDMETDQFATLFLALIAHGMATQGPAQSGRLEGLWVLGLGSALFLVLPAFKYAFALGLRNAPRVNEPKPAGQNNTRGRRICASVLIGLLACTLPVLQESSVAAYGRLALALVLVALLGSSFAGDLRYMKKPAGASRSG